MGSYDDDPLNEYDPVCEIINITESSGDNCDRDDVGVDLESYVKMKKQASKMATNKDKGKGKGKAKRPPPHLTNLGDLQFGKRKKSLNSWEYLKKINTFLAFLKILYDALLKLLGSWYVTDNFYAPKLHGIGWTISSFLTHEDEGIRHLAKKMKLKRNKSSYDSQNVTLLSSKIKVAFCDLVDFYGSSQPKAKKLDHDTSSSSSYSYSVGDNFVKPTELTMKKH
ncbi:hypothetical protein Cgig2_001684 [Carnegiea gigantea]|uniref:Uncharacterized protein n=1 Tax=Carnegiea gigantea TaxID=171969 RepID=A0A9Q1JTA2_9CARY|nr:hypothetical protein Cgig2_001684 [Carnegiea gigantea]